MKLFSALFKKSVDPPNCDVLTDKSPVMTYPSTQVGSVALWHHQKAMLQRCSDIEKYNMTMKLLPSNIDRFNQKNRPEPVDVGIGIMNDPPGCGKTYVMLGLMALDASPTTNIVIVPPNLHHQWVEATNKFLPDFKYKVITEYSQTVQLYNEDIAKKYFKDLRLIITTTMFSDAVASGLITAKMDVDRVIIDEIDTATSGFHNVPKCKRVWFMSASFDPKTNRKIGPFDMTHMALDEIGRLICRCDAAFMQKYQEKLEEPETVLIEVKDGAIALFKNLVHEHVVGLLNALNLQTAKNKVLRNRDTVVRSGLQLAQELLAQYDESVKQLTESLGTESDDESESDYKTESLKQEREENKKNYNILKQRIEDYKLDEDNFNTTKLDEISKICSEMTTETSSKWIFFSDDDFIFEKVEPLFKEKDLKYVSLAEGSVQKNEVAINLYKRDPMVRAVFINSMKDGCGLNLENTTHVLFLHRTNPAMVEQVIGRAQRPGRKNRLKIVCLYHTNEMPVLSS